MQPLKDRIAVVAGATRGAGRGIACMLGEAGATVYCTGRSVAGMPPAVGVHAGRPETIEETAEMVSARGGVGLAVRVDHTVEDEVKRFFARVKAEQKRLDILVNVLGGDTPAEFKPFGKLSLDKGFRWLKTELGAHITTSRYAAALMVEGKRRERCGLVVEITEGHTLAYRQSLFYDLVKVSTIRLAYAMAEELRGHNVASVALTPGYMRTEAMLSHFGVTEENWRDGAKKDPGFNASETPFFVGRAVAALASDERVLEKSGGLYSSWALAEEYGFTDIDGIRPPHLVRYFEEQLKTPLATPPRTGLRWKIESAPRPEGKTEA